MYMHHILLCFGKVDAISIKHDVLSTLETSSSSGGFDILEREQRAWRRRVRVVRSKCSHRLLYSFKNNMSKYFYVKYLLYVLVEYLHACGELYIYSEEHSFAVT